MTTRAEILKASTEGGHRRLAMLVKQEAEEDLRRAGLPATKLNLSRAKAEVLKRYPGLTRLLVQEEKLAKRRRTGEVE